MVSEPAYWATVAPLRWLTRLEKSRAAVVVLSPALGMLPMLARAAVRRGETGSELEATSIKKPMTARLSSGRRVSFDSLHHY